MDVVDLLVFSLLDQGSHGTVHVGLPIPELDRVEVFQGDWNAVLQVGAPALRYHLFRHLIRPHSSPNGSISNSFIVTGVNYLMGLIQSSLGTGLGLTLD